VTGLSGTLTSAVAGGQHSLALKSDGTVWAWGSNRYGQLGNGTSTDSSTPVQISALSGVVAIGAGDTHSLAIKSDGSVWAWGDNSSGQLGDGTTTQRKTPVAVLNLSGATRATGGNGFSLAQRSDGTLWAWGLNNKSQLGNGTTTDSHTPVQVAGLTGVTTMVAGYQFSLALKTDGSTWAWGDNSFGQLGDGTTTVRRTPVQVPGLGGSTRLAAGRVHSLATTGSQPQNSSISYGYDKLYRLTSASGPVGNNTYTYDPVGNRLSKVLGGQTTSSTYDKADRILTAGSTSYTVNNAGNLVAGGTDTFSYDQVNRLTSASVAGATGTYRYDGDGKRISKTVGATTTNYVYDIGSGLPVLLDDGSRKYVWGAGGLAFTVDKSTAAVQVYHTDGLGSVRSITDSTGSVVQAYQTDEFGIPVLTQGTSGQPFGLTGEQHDPEDGLVYLRARTYDPTVGRFLQADPLRDTLPGSQGWNRYAYAGNNPVSSVDPSGLAAKSRTLRTEPMYAGPLDPRGWVGPLIAAVAAATQRLGTSPPPNGPIQEVSVDADVLIAALGEGRLAELDQILAGRIPVISPTAALQVQSNRDALVQFLADRGGRIGAVADLNQMAQLQAQAASLGRALAAPDASVASSALQEGLTLLTKDVRFYRFLQAAGYASEQFPP
jgi:RHS repeat-associated protein